MIFSNKNIYHFSILLCIAVSLSSCLALKPNAQKSAKSLVETFYIGEKGIQYFIKPLRYDAKNNNGKLNLDCTYRYKSNVSDEDSAMINFSVFTEEPLKSFDRITFAKTVQTFDNVNLMFVEKDKDLFKSRFSTKISLNELKSFFKSKTKLVKIDVEATSLDFLPRKSSKKNMNIIYQDVMKLID